MQVSSYSTKVEGSNLIWSYVFTNGYTAEQWQPSNPYSGSALIVYTPTGFFASDKVAAKALKAINKYNS